MTADTRRRPATARQLWSLNMIGGLGEALEDDGRAYADRAHELLASAKERGEMPGQVRDPQTEQVGPREVGVT